MHVHTQCVKIERNTQTNKHTEVQTNKQASQQNATTHASTSGHNLKHVPARACVTMFQKSAQPGFSAGLGLFGAGLPLVYIFHLLSAGFSSFKCRFCPFRCRFCLFRCRFCLFKCRFCPLGRKRERLKLSGNPLRAVL